MNSTYSVNPGRLLLLIRSYIYVNRTLILVLAAVFLALTILNAIGDTFTQKTPDLYDRIFFLLLFVSGFLITRRIGKELHDSRKGPAWLLLPASTMEKFLTLLLLPTLILICGAAIYMAIMSIFVEQGIGLFISSFHDMFNPFNTHFWIGLNIYITIQAPFLLGVIYFKKHGLSFTFLSLFIYSVILVIFTSITGRLLLSEHIAPIINLTSIMDSSIKMQLMILFEKLRHFGVIWKPVFTVIFSCLLPLVCWITAFISLKEMEQ